MQHALLLNLTSPILADGPDPSAGAFGYPQDEYNPGEDLKPESSPGSFETPDEDLMYRYPWQVNVVLLVGYVSVFVIGLIGNLCVIVVVMRTPRMRGSVTNRLIVNLACVDIVVLLICVPSNLLSNLIHREYSKTENSIIYFSC